MPNCENNPVPGTVSRAGAAIIGGYALALAFTAAATLVLQRGAGWARGEAVITAAMLAFVVYLLAALRVFVAPSALRAWGEPVTTAVALAALAAALA